MWQVFAHSMGVNFIIASVTKWFFHHLIIVRSHGHKWRLRRAMIVRWKGKCERERERRWRKEIYDMWDNTQLTINCRCTHHACNNIDSRVHTERRIKSFCSINAHLIDWIPYFNSQPSQLKKKKREIEPRFIVPSSDSFPFCPSAKQVIVVESRWY